METFVKQGLIGRILYSKDDGGNNDVTDIQCGKTDLGECYKDAWDCGDVIYISENGAIDYCNRKGNGIEFEDIAWTREKWLDWVTDELELEMDRAVCKEFAEYVAKMIFDEAEWEDLTTRLSEWLNGNDLEDVYFHWNDDRFDRDAFLDYCKKNISHYESRLDYAWEKMDKYRCPLSHADSELYDNISECLEEWCEGKGIDINEIDTDEIF